MVGAASSLWGLGGCHVEGELTRAPQPDLDLCSVARGAPSVNPEGRPHTASSHLHQAPCPTQSWPLAPGPGLLPRQPSRGDRLLGVFLTCRSPLTFTGNESFVTSIEDKSPRHSLTPPLIPSTLGSPLGSEASWAPHAPSRPAACTDCPAARASAMGSEKMTLCSLRQEQLQARLGTEGRWGTQTLWEPMPRA